MRRRRDILTDHKLHTPIKAELDPPPGAERRTRLKDRKKSVAEALVRAGQALFSTHAVDAVAIDDIVREAGVAKGSFYAHFPDKESLLEAVAYQIRDRIEQEVTAANAGVTDPALRVARATCIYFRFVAEQPEQGGVLVRNDRSGQTLPSMQINKGIVDDVSAGLRQGRFVAASVEAGALFVLGVSHAGLVRFHADRETAFNFAIAQQLCQLVLRGLGLTAIDANSISQEAANDILHQPHTPIDPA